MVELKVLEERVIKLRAWLLARVKLAKLVDADKRARYKVLVTYAFPSDKVYGKGRSWNSISDWNADSEQLRHLADVIDLFDEKAAKLELFGEENSKHEKEENKGGEVEEHEYDFSTEAALR